MSGSGKEVDLTYTNAIANYLLLCLFSQCNVTVNGTAVMQSNEQSNYRSYLETLLNYGTDAAASHLFKHVLVSRQRRHAVLRSHDRAVTDTTIEKFIA